MDTWQSNCLLIPLTPEKSMEPIRIEDYTYELPEDRIALFPLAERDQSRLLVYKDHHIEHSHFKQLVEFLPSHSTLFFNNTKVIPARLYFQKSTGATIELFLLNPMSPSSLLQQAMQATRTTQWQCTIGNLKRWTPNTTLIKQEAGLTLCANLVDRENGVVEFSWEPEGLSFAEVISTSGTLPLPPYLNRAAQASDRQTYQTVYSKHEGAVAAPTAGLHFTNTILEKLEQAGHTLQYLTLHVSAGTFQPVKVQNALEHTMHHEQVLISRKNLEALLDSTFTVAVGTTSLRTLESLYWYGVKLKTNPQAQFHISQQDPYQLKPLPAKIVFTEVLNLFTRLNTDLLVGSTSIYIVPGYKFRVVDALITNFHQPASTLILLIAALVGPDWRKIYSQALQQHYRFLSYGDSSLLFKV